MPNTDRLAAVIRIRWAFAAGVLTGVALIQLLGLYSSAVYGAGLLTMGLVSTVADWRRIRG